MTIWIIRPPRKLAPRCKMSTGHYCGHSVRITEQSEVIHWFRLFVEKGVQASKASFRMATGKSF